MVLTSINPAKTAKKVAIKLIKVYKTNCKNSPFFKKVTFSKAKAENVVNPPQNPTVNNNTKGPVELLLLKYPSRNPRIKLPTTLTNNVPNGI